MSRPTPRVFNIPASAPFLPTLIRALFDGRIVPGFPSSDEPLALAEATLYLPTRRACRLARDMFLEALEGDAAILPSIVALGDIDEDEIIFAEAATREIAGAALDLPEPLSAAKRRMLLTRLVLQWAAAPGMRGEAGARLVASSPAAAFALADDLARLMDDMTTRQVSWEKLDGLVPDHVDLYWQKTLDFLKIARERWPEVLKEHGKMEPAARRDALIAAERKRLAQSNTPVIAAGSTGSMPSTAALLATIAHLPQGAVVLPGLDTDLDEDSWNTIGSEDRAAGTESSPAVFGHPQHALHGLLRRLEISRAEVAPLAESAAFGREALLSESFRPAETTHHWQTRLAPKSFAERADAALANISMIEAGGAEEEALAIALALREALETPGRTAALVTPDRGLARRVLAALRRWKMPVEDSAGDKLVDTPAGIFAALAAETALGGAAPVTLLALLKHPLCRLSTPMAAHVHAVASLEKAVLRGPRPRPGTAGLSQALVSFRRARADLHASDPRKHMPESDLDAAAALVERLAQAFQPLETIGSKPDSFVALASSHQTIVETLSRDTAGDITAYSGADGHALAHALDGIG